MKTHLALYLQAQNADASHTQDLAKLAWLRRPRLCISIGELFAFALWRGLRHGYVSPRPCSSRSLCDRDTLPFNLLMRNFKRNSACYEQPRVTSTESSCGVGRAEKTKIPSATVVAAPIRSKLCVRRRRLRSIGFRPTLMPEASVFSDGTQKRHNLFGTVLQPVAHYLE